MRIFTGQYDRTLDSKNRIQIPAQLRSAMDPKRDGDGLYVTLGEHRGTLSIYTEREFEALASRMETEFMPGEKSRRFELQFYSLATFVEPDKQGRLVLSDQLVRKAKLKDELVLVGQKRRIDVWNKQEFEKSLAIDWEGDEWPDWQGYLRMRPSQSLESDL